MGRPKGPQPLRYAIQKARGKGWKTLEVGEDLPHAEARFDLMVEVNPRAYFRLVQLEYNAEADYEGMEFNWKLIHLYDPSQGPRKGMKRHAFLKPASLLDSGRTGSERIPLPIRFYIGAILVGALGGLLAYFHFVGGAGAFR